MSPRLFSLLFAAAALCFTLTAAAKDNAKPPPGYTAAVNEALAELEAMNYPEARAEFARAHAIFPNARTLRGLGMVEFELRHYAESKRLLEESLGSTVRPLDDKMRADTQTLLERARRYLSEVFVKVTPAAAELTIDGSPAEVQPGGAIQLEVGEHVLEARASGRATERRTLTIKGGERLDVTLKLELLAPPPVAAAAPGPVADPAQPIDKPVDKPAYKKWWVWTTVAIVAAGGATAAVLLLKRDGDPATEPQRGTNSTGVALQSLRSF